MRVLFAVPPTACGFRGVTVAALRRLAWVVSIFSFIFPLARASGIPSQSLDRGVTSGFEQLDRWRSAVLAGDRAAIKDSYISAPQSFAVTPEGKITDPAGEESEYWSGLHAQGLTAMTAKILQRNQPQPGLEQMVLRLELTFQLKGQTTRSLIGALQVWANVRGNWGIFMSQRSAPAHLEEMRLPEPSVPNVHLYPEPEEATKELADALASAKEDKRRVLVVFGANWCYDCHVLDEAMHSLEITPVVAANYHVVHINIGDGQSNGELASRFHVPMDKGIPGIAVVDPDGNVVTSQTHGEFESAAKIGMKDVLEFLTRWAPPAK
jgi:thioredoxin 1